MNTIEKFTKDVDLATSVISKLSLEGQQDLVEFEYQLNYLTSVINVTRKAVKAHKSTVFSLSPLN